MPQAYTYTGTQQLGYFAYVDLSTDKMLIASPGGTYSMRTTDPAFAVPPSDGNWVAADPLAPVPPAPKPAVKITTLPEGGDAA